MVEKNIHILICCARGHSHWRCHALWSMAFNQTQALVMQHANYANRELTVTHAAGNVLLTQATIFCLRKIQSLILRMKKRLKTLGSRNNQMGVACVSNKAKL